VTQGNFLVLAHSLSYASLTIKSPVAIGSLLGLISPFSKKQNHTQYPAAKQNLSRINGSYAVIPAVYEDISPRVLE
jgi:hypothetical protein